MTKTQNNYQKYEEDRKQYTKKILESDALKKIVIAGPGTGKSYLFEKICKKCIEQGKNNILTLSFINELVDDLAVRLHEESEVKTLHSFALSKLGIKNKYFLGLEGVISKDHEIIYGGKINYTSRLCNLIASEREVEFFFNRQQYYNHHSPVSSVYRLIQIFKSDASKIPSYSQILIDEYQDFNKLESTLIDLLAQKSPILIVGDDDQSLYCGLKYAEPKLIRTKENSGYVPFDLPYCSRCTKVIVAGFNTIVDEAKKRGFLKKRHDKPFKYFPSKEKDKISDYYNTISIKKKVYKNSEGYHIDDAIKKHVDPRMADKTSILIICPFKKHVEHIEKMLRKKGYRNITTRATNNRKKIVGSFNLLLEDSKSNLGWRIAAEQILEVKQFSKILKRNYQDKKGTEFYNLLDIATRKYIKAVRATLAKIRKGENVDKKALEQVIECLGYDSTNIMTDTIKQDIEAKMVKKNTHKDIPIKITTIQGSKGLEGNFVFLVYFDERYILDNGKTVTDESLNKFLVSLTRAKDKLFIYSSGNKLPAFTQWLNTDIYELEGST